MRKTTDSDVCTRRHSIIARVCFLAYCLLMIWLLFGQRMDDLGSGTYFEQLGQHLALTPFATIGQYISHLFSQNAAQVRFAIVNLGGNVIMFLPLGFLLPCVFGRINTALRCLLWTVIIILSIELIQLFTLLGFCDIDDFVLNICGSMLGYGALKLVRRFWRM